MAAGATGGQQLFALVDVNNFYVSCERVFNPALEKRRVVVLSNNDGCAIARSNEVKALGVKMGAPWFQLQELAQQHDIVALSSNYALYGDISNRVASILRDSSPNVEVYFIDESFLSLNGLGTLWPSAAAMGQSIRRRIRQWTGLPVCVGIGPTKTLAKLANHMAKKNPLFDGVCDVAAMREAQCNGLIAAIEVGEVWGVGRRIRAREQDAQYSSSLVIPLPNASCDTRMLVGVALFSLKKIYRTGYAYKKAGVMLMGIGQAQVAQGSLLLEHGSGERSERLMMAMDALNRRYGRNTISVFSTSSPKA